MKLLDNYSSFKLFLISFVSAIFIVYPNIACLPWELSFLDESKHGAHLTFFVIRYTFFLLLIWRLLYYNLRKITDLCFKNRAIRTFLITAVAYVLFVAIMYLWYNKIHGFGSILLFQFFVVFIVCTFVGHVFMMYNVQRRKEQEIEQLKIENLQSRCDALANQINPHFFFNSLNSLSALIRKKEDENTLAFVNKLSDVFRYILQSDKKGLVSLNEELEFVEAFRYMMEVRFANKLEFDIEVDQGKLDLKIPVLSLLPLIDNIVVHNTIDSQYKMTVTIRLNEQCELVVSNPIHPKLTPAETNGTGIRNLENRFILLMNQEIRIEDNGNTFTVYLPLASNC
ncbi:histidine kinase [Parabacteroides sp. PF5-6]|uniref:sensor histidine kinase n=1 Tax=Parabacteroides sp. PF5-6 TaxID=1742403 RepID=UPI0024070AF9|nr:histidine kinase [Parabacteroides sp. PF5-6]MDF9831401.1 heme/copper-type cytochrome/quinol oxidase subunit 4 [Parabacteroides sp. PF5-6]